MKNNELQNYKAPQVEVIEVEIEKGFATSESSGGTSSFGENNGTW